MGMASLNPYLKKRGGMYYLHYFENGVRQRLSLGTEDVQVAKKKQRVFDSARVRGEDKSHHNTLQGRRESSFENIRYRVCAKGSSQNTMQFPGKPESAIRIKLQPCVTNASRYVESVKTEYWFFPSPRRKHRHPDTFFQALCGPRTKQRALHGVVWTIDIRSEANWPCKVRAYIR
jgi:hypothetical protein